MTAERATHVVLLTPEGRGAVASLLVCGPDATTIVGRLFHSPSGAPLADRPLGRIVYGRWLSPEAGEEVVVCRRDEDRVEIHCHGGTAAASAILDALGRYGAQRVDWQSWLQRTAGDPIEAAADVALAQATTQRTAAILWDQRRGALRRALDEIAKHVAAGDVARSLAGVDALLDQAPVGLHLVEPWRVVLAGRPNVGKSSLINALVGYERAIVHATPGTTRDLVTAAAALDGWPVELTDTAGLHASDDALEQAGMRLAREQLWRADLVVLVFDASRPWSADDEALALQWPTALCVFNKCDLLRPDDGNEVRPSRCTSAIAGQGIEELGRAISERLVSEPPRAGQAVPFLSKQVEALTGIRRAVESDQLSEAAELLSGRESWGGTGC